jgi:hypothetical protein
MASHLTLLAFSNADALNDLTTVLVINKTEIPFFTSDNPTVAINQFWEKHGHPCRGWSAKHIGYSQYLPLTPEMLLVCFDGEAYTLAHDVAASGTLYVTDPNYIKVLNALQILNSSGNIYFRDLKHADIILESIEANYDDRRSRLTETIYFRTMYDRSGNQVLVKISALELNKFDGVEQLNKEVPIVPKAWPAILKMRPDVKLREYLHRPNQKPPIKPIDIFMPTNKGHVKL